jgi:hypothetical protein
LIPWPWQSTHHANAIAAPPAIAMVLQEDIAEEMEEEVVEEALHCAA